jgi:hypothetical protein
MIEYKYNTKSCIKKSHVLVLSKDKMLKVHKNL